MIDPITEAKYDTLITIIKEFKSVIVAFSGGVDSSVLALASFEALKDNAIAVNIASELTPSAEIKLANDVASFISIKYQQLPLQALKNNDLQRNDKNRCYFCKYIIINELKLIAQASNIAYIIDGANTDDLFDYRPGMKATQELNVKHPFIEANIGKDDIREIAKWKNLPNSEWPSMACLGSRIAYNTPLDADVLKRIDRGEDFIRSMGYLNVRIRYHEDIIRIELPPLQIPQFINSNDYSKVLITLKELGFIYITLDLEGYRMGSMNAMLKESI
jgi:pyridinium-3,5-biscarboxylic acid mononucleotide sulfurtransferase